MNDENKGVLIGIGMSLFILAFIQMIGLIEGDSDDIYTQQITQALAVCENNGGLYMIDGEMYNSHKFICHNGAVFTFDPKRDAEEEE